MTPTTDDRMQEVRTLTPMQALIRLIRENDVQMTERNAYLWTLIEDALTALPPAQAVEVELPAPHWARDLHGESEVFTRDDVRQVIEAASKATGVEIKVKENRGA